MILRLFSNGVCLRRHRMEEKIPKEIFLIFCILFGIISNICGRVENWEMCLNWHLLYIFWFLLDIIVVLTGHIDINSWLKIFNLDVDFLSSFNLTSFFFLLATKYICQSHYFCWITNTFFFSFKYRSCLLDVLNFSFFNMTEVIK